MSAAEAFVAVVSSCITSFVWIAAHWYRCWMNRPNVTDYDWD